MQDVPLSIARLLRYGSTVHAPSTVTTWTGEGSRRATFADIGARAAQLAHALRELGVTGDERVATFMFNNQEHLEAYLAVPSMGAVLHTLNIRLFPEQLVYIANHAEDRVIIVDGALIPLLAKVLPEMTTVRHVIVSGAGDRTPLAIPSVQVHGYDELIGGQPTTFDWPEVDERDAAAICYTSGTTGNPKGVVYSHRSIWLHSTQVCMAEGFGLSDRELVLAVVPQFHAMSWGLMYAAFMSGASLLMPDRFLQAAPLAQMIEQERPTFAGAVPTIWNDLLHHLDANGGDVSSLREVVVGGSACPPALMDAFWERYGVRIIHAWGMTEISPLGSVARPPARVTDEVELRAYRVSQGRVPASVEPRLVGPDGELVPWDGESVGELEVRGPIGGWFVWNADVPAVLVGGGSGVVPLMAMLRLARRSVKTDLLRVVVSVRSPDDLFYAQEIVGPETTIVYTRASPPSFSRPPGRLSASDLPQPVALGSRAYVCGSSGFADAASGVLLAAGVPTEQIRVERFGPTG